MNTKTNRAIAVVSGALILVIVATLFYSRPEPIHQGLAVDAPGAASPAGVQRRDNSSPGTQTPMEVEWRTATDAELAQRHEAVAQRSANVAPAPLPVALQNPQAAQILPPAQAQAVEAVRVGFAKAMQAAGDPSSREYLARWMEEKERADQLLMTYLGPEDFKKVVTPRP